MSIRTTNESTTGSPRKLALVIGNSKYEDGQNLSNTVNDAIKMASALKTIGFDIVTNEAQLNLTYEDMLHALVRFKCLIKAGDTIVFYYSGHGKEYNHQNYLIPVDNITKDGQNRAQISGDDLRASAMNVQDTLAELTDRKPFVIIFFLDCCRLYRLRNENIINRPKGGSMNQSQTFRSLTATAGSLIAFACGPGSMADDGKKGETNGLFTKHLLKHIINPNEDVLSILACVIRDVQEESNGQQIPNYTGALTQRFVYLCETVPREYEMDEILHVKADVEHTVVLIL